MARVERPTVIEIESAGPLTFLQPERGYRFNVDSLHLVQFARVGKTVETVVDLGAGSGVLGISLLALGAARSGHFVELDPDQAQRCAQNLTLNGLSGEVVAADVAEAVPSGPAGLVVCNPPYFAPDEGRPPHDPAERRARFGGIEAFVRAASRFCGPRGRACFVYPARSAMRLFQALRGAGLEPRRLAWVHPRTTAPARLVLVEARPARTGHPASTGLLVEAARIEQL